MGAFDHVLVLLSFVYALALAQLLTRIGVLMTVRKRVAFSGLLALAAGVSILLVYLNWLSLWDLRTVRDWDIVTISVQFALAVTLFFICGVSMPEAPGEGRVDLEAFYWDQRSLYFGMLFAVIALSVAGNIAYFKTSDPSLFLRESNIPLLAAIPTALAWSVKARWAQWTGLGLNCALLIYFMIAFEGRLS
jgi:hypothetical protein